MGINLATDDFGHRGWAAASAAAAVLATSAWIRSLHVQAPLRRYALHVLLIAALVLSVAVSVTPGSWAGPLLLATCAIVATAVLLPTALSAAARLLGGVALVGAGEALLVAAFTSQDSAGAAARAVAIALVLVGGTVVVVLGISRMFAGRVTAGVVLTGAGTAATTSAALLMQADMAAGVAVWVDVLFGLAGCLLAGLGVAKVLGSERIAGLSAVGFGAACCILVLSRLMVRLTGHWRMRDVDDERSAILLFVAFVVLGVITVSWGAAKLVEIPYLAGATLTGLGALLLTAATVTWIRTDGGDVMGFALVLSWGAALVVLGLARLANRRGAAAAVGIAAGAILVIWAVTGLVGDNDSTMPAVVLAGGSAALLWGVAELRAAGLLTRPRSLLRRLVREPEDAPVDPGPG
ncbi:hypothetical protein KOI35_11505 [Actinoplanes bogorensis]|uniref:Uncharacterized protein n=1 Tax=Paractinoplanes bogorensis TaxID=1610840 RepID=A0ABS5YL35_9ACTN|nr:hypothetical protein [Actinoplanes bogorensis]MBU2664118.1 hypothetical protein [Actinoplanes bogorensis]